MTLMTIVIGLIGIVAVLVVARAALAYRVRARRYAEPFDGVVYRVGSAAIAERAAAAPRCTVIGMHGFVEDLRYFVRYYADPDIQLILINSADYHVPIADAEFRPAAWATTPAFAEGTIEYDAAVLIQALQHLPKTRAIRVHGHSRGGAVALEAAAMRPDLFRDVEVILEAPVLPQAKFAEPPSALVRWSLPFVMPLWRRAPISNYNKHRWGRLDDARKRELIKGFPFCARRDVTLVRNIRSLGEWAERRGYDVYAHIARGAVLIADADRVLDSISMRESAAHAPPSVRTIGVEDCSHFVSLDRPQAIPPLVRETRESRRRPEATTP